MRKNQTQAELAEAIDVSVRHLQAIELGTVTPSLQVLVALANALETPLATLMRRSGSVRRPAPGRPKKKRTK